MAEGPAEDGSAIAEGPAEDGSAMEWGGASGRRTRRGWLCNGGRVGGKKKKRAEDCSAMEGAAPKVERSAKERGARRKPVLSPPVGPPESAGWVLIGPQQRP